MAKSPQTSAGHTDLPQQSTPTFDPPTGKATPVPSAESSFDEYTLSAYGDISLTNVYFVPMLPPDISLREKDPEFNLQNKQTRAPGTPQFSKYLVEHRRPSVIRNIAPASPTKAVTTYTDDFEKLVENLRPLHESTKLNTPTKPLCPRPRRDAINLRVIEKKRDSPKPHLPAARTPIAPLPSVPIAVTRPKPKGRPLRGYARLPPRPPIPRWDLLDPAVYGTASKKCRTS